MKIFKLIPNANSFQFLARAEKELLVNHTQINTPVENTTKPQNLLGGDGHDQASHGITKPKYLDRPMTSKEKLRKKLLTDANPTYDK